MAKSKKKKHIKPSASKTTNKKPKVSKKVVEQTPPKKRDWLAFAFMAAAFLFYIPALYLGITNYDDERYILGNPIITELNFASIKTMFTEFFDGHYHPLSQLSLAIDYAIGGGNAKAYHFTHILLHALNAGLVYWISKKLINNSIIIITATALFAFHPIMTESVCWLSERKNVLMGFFYFSTLLSYLKYLDNPGFKSKWYYASIALFLCAVLSKAPAVSLVPTLFLVDYLRKRSFNTAMILEKIPYFLIALAIGLYAITAQKSDWGDLNLEYSYLERFALAGTGYLLYLQKILLPFNLSAYYPYPDDIDKGISALNYAAPILGLILTGGLVWYFRNRKRLIVFGILFFALNIVLLLKFLDFPYGKYLMADRYAYIPALGIFLIIGYFLSRINERFRFSGAKLLIPIGLLLVLGFVGQKRIQVWNSSQTVWSDVIKNYPAFYLSYNMRGIASSFTGDFDNAISDLTMATQLKPEMKDSYFNLATVEAMRQNHQKVIEWATIAISKDEGYAAAYNKRGTSKLALRDDLAALNDLKYAVELEPDELNFNSDLGRGFKTVGNSGRAIQYFDKAVEGDPSNGYYRFLRAVTYFDLNQNQKACTELIQAAKDGYAQASQVRSQYCR